MYKVLDVREYNKPGHATMHKDITGNNAKIHIPQSLRFVVIAEDVPTAERVRFEFFDAYEFEFGNKTHYGGFLGDFELLIPGDYFVIEDTPAQKKVCICKL